MQEEDVADVKMEGEDGGLSYKRKYKDIKQKVKYLAYEHECFQHDLQKAQEKLLQLAKDKNCLLDQLLRCEAVMLSDDEEQTDYSTDEEEEADTPYFNPQRTELNSKSQHSNNLKSSPKSSQPKQGAVKPSQVSSPKVVTDTPKSGTKRQLKSVIGGSSSSSGSHLSTAAKIAKTVAKAHTAVNPKQTQPQSQPGSLVVSLPLGQLTPKVKQQQQSVPPPPALTLPPASDLAPPPLPPLSSHVGATDGHKPASSSSSSSSSSDSDSSSESSSSSDEAGDQTSGPVPIMSGVHSNVATKGVSQLVRPKALTSPSNPPPPPKLIFVGDGPLPALSRSTSSPPLQPQPQQQPGVFTWSNRQQPTESSPAAGPPGFTPILPILSSPTFNKPSPGSAFHVVSPKCDSKPSSIAL